ncbi:DUF983 domain-containing protein [Rhabdobacter roseus]|uniref:Uncharacterized protein (DUF983 family) n=1 Tax=Rhabdobacter roseus TaxID=1655419 RepID=A0A840TNH1_9BACT|nr:DUF983 domain-containing protein [Rhabdobacter roseus]MBB5283307.1 uncharacterized protein (DUF983 family) [Rhabdobacter roseus]
MIRNTRLYSVLFNKCPRCHTGAFFVSKSAYRKNFDEMHTHCPHCGENYVPEPGFYWGSMYMSYGLYVLFMLGTFLLLVVGLGVDVMHYLLGLTPVLVLLLPYFFRLARRSWLAIFIAPDRSGRGTAATGTEVMDIEKNAAS